MIKDNVIIGSGPAGYTAAIYLSRFGIKTCLITGMDIGGQLATTSSVENYTGFSKISGFELTEKMKQHSEEYVEEIIYSFVQKIEKEQGIFNIFLDDSNIIQAKSIIIATGASAKWIGFENEDKFKNHGISACATCDGFFFKGKDVAVVGGGNTAFEEALFLSKLCSKVYLIHRKEDFRAEQYLVKMAKANPKIEILTSKKIIKADSKSEKLEKIVIQDLNNKEENEIFLSGLFIAIGRKPNTENFKNIVELDENGYIKTKNTLTSCEGIFAAGDVQDPIYRQAIVAAASGSIAAIETKNYLEQK